MSIAIDESERGTAEIRQPDLPEFYEIIDGEIVEVMPMSHYANRVASRLNRAVTINLASNDIGETAIEDMFPIPTPDDAEQCRRPDWAFISYERRPRDLPDNYTGNAYDVAPDIAAEIVSPTNTSEELISKARDYLRAGVRLVWIVYPIVQEVHAYLPGSNQIHVFFVTDELEAPEILPGFRKPVASLFPVVNALPTVPDDS
jgi:Uma2 family endonuclease